MNKCLKITFSAINLPEDFLRAFVREKAQQLKLEGIAQVIPADKRIKIIACGLKDNVDTFVDDLHKGDSKIYLEDIEIEPFSKDRDYRGVFRVIM